MLNKRNMAKTITILSLDAMKEFYSDVGIVQYQDEIHTLFKDIVKNVNKEVIFKNQFVEELYGNNTYENIYETLAEKTLKLHEEQAKFLRKWFWNAYSGQHCSDLSLSSWKAIFIQWASYGFNSEVYDQKEHQAVLDLIQEYKEIDDFLEYKAMTIDFAENDKLTDYDKEIHRLYGYNYFDDMYDPFLIVRILHSAYIFRKFVKNSKALKYNTFPFEKIRISAMSHLEEIGVPLTQFMNDIRTVGEFHKEEDICQK